MNQIARTLLLTVILSLAALAAQVAPARADARQHDGWYLRLGVGGGVAFGNLSTTTDSASSGANVATELAIGKNLRPGLVVGVGTFPMVVPSPSYDGVDAGGQHVSGTGPFIDWYRTPSGGLHLQGGLLFAAGYLDGGDRDGQVGFGYGAMVGAGFDRYVTQSLSLGLLARVTAYRLHGVDDNVRLASPSLLVTATFD